MSVIDELKAWLLETQKTYSPDRLKHASKLTVGAALAFDEVINKLEELQARGCEHEFLSVCKIHGIQSCLCQYTTAKARCHKCGYEPKEREEKE